MDLAQVLMQVNNQNAARRARYMANPAALDADGDLPLDHPSLAGTNPVIDALIAQNNQTNAAAQQLVGGISPMDFAADFLQAPLDAAPQVAPANLALQQIAQLPGASTNIQVPQAQAQPAVAGPGNNPTDIIAALLGMEQPQAQPAAMPQQQQQSASVGSELSQMQVPQGFERAPSIGDILNEVTGQSSAGGQTQGQNTGPQSTEVSLAALLNDPSMARLLVSMGSSLTQGDSFATAVQQGLATKDAIETGRVDAAYTAKKRNADLTKTSAEVVKAIADAGLANDQGTKAKADAKKATVEAGMAGYNAETDRIKAQASQLSANAAYKSATTEAEKALRALTGGEPLGDKEYSTVFADILNATQGNIILNQELAAKGMSAREFTTMMMNQTVKDPNGHRYIPLTSSRAAAIRQENEKINNLPDTPENQQLSADFQKKILEDFTFIYGADALYKAMQGK